jgi:predicted dehydrogenase
MQDKPLSIGIVGAGEITRRAHLPVLSNTPGARIAWLHDKRPASAQALARAYGINAVEAATPAELPPCDVALLAIPVDARGEYLRHFAARGAAVFCEKPFALSEVQYRTAVEGFEPHALGCGYMRRFFRPTILLRQIVAAGVFGPLLGIDVAEGGRSKGSGVDASFLDDPRLGAARGVLADLGSHSLDLALYLAGASGFSVRSCRMTRDGAVDRKVDAEIELQTARPPTMPPIRMQYGVSWLDRQENAIRLRFAHTCVWSALAPNAEVHLGMPDRLAEAMTVTASVGGATTYNQAFFLEWQAFLEGVRARRESCVSAQSAFLTTCLLETLLGRGDSP